MRGEGEERNGGGDLAFYLAYTCSDNPDTLWVDEHVHISEVS